MKYYRITTVNNQTFLYVCDSETKSSFLISKSEDLPSIDAEFIYLDDEFYQLFKKEDKVYGVCTYPMYHDYALENIIVEYPHREFTLEGEDSTLVIRTNKGNNSVTIKEVTIPGIHYNGTIEFKLDTDNKPFNLNYPLSSIETALISFVLDN